ncbi:hypothetical protein M433DRAFT_240975 [Acidomyces richmondensis BFW]|nr:MAG: hypothetical protein FE78DRAFT_79769 [Acidomyces sp. 'richmondensis']KYG45702.1 hypothetical protein M433DRAFT_240975 [Acidomyces richmondensis BFW]
MAGKEELTEFPDVSQKLSAPKRMSAFEKKRQDEEAKKRRDEAENAEVLKAFEESFADEDLERAPSSGHRATASEQPSYGSDLGYAHGRYGEKAMGPRHELGDLSQPLTPLPSLKRKRELDEARERQEMRREQQTLLSEMRSESRDTLQESEHDGVPEDAPRPRIQVSSLPNDFTLADVEDILKDYVKVHSIDITPSSAMPGSGKRSQTAIATLSADTENKQIDAAIAALKDKYLGCGFRLSISRYLSSTALHPTISTMAFGASVEPFGAERVKTDARKSHRNAPPPLDFRGEFAPPESYESSSRGRYSSHAPPSELRVHIKVPSDIYTTRCIHALVQRLLLQSNPIRAIQLECALMRDEKIQKDDRFSFLYDSYSPAGMYYRWLLWETDVFISKDAKRRARATERIFDDTDIDFLPPYSQTPFSDLRNLSEMVTHVDYISSEGDSDDEEGERRLNDGRSGHPASNEGSEKTYLSPLKRAKLLHLVSRLPHTHTMLRIGDLARLTNFVINHAGEGAEEIVDVLLLNVEKPLCYSLAAKYEDHVRQDKDDEYEPDLSLPTVPDSERSADGKKDSDDGSNAKLVALYAISDILSASSTAGARNAWKYRQLFEAGFKRRNTFAKLGRVDRDLGWGRIKGEQWRRKMEHLFNIWEGWSIFGPDVQNELRQSFENPPLTKEESIMEAEKIQREEKRKTEDKLRGRFHRVGGWSPSASASPTPLAVSEDHVLDGKNGDGQPMDEGTDGLPMNEDADGLPMDEDADGLPMDEDADGLPMDEEVDGMLMEEEAENSGIGTGDVKMENTQERSENAKISLPSVVDSNTPKANSGFRKGRMRAEDMFGASDLDD